jgi:ubiquinone/menaquinone biosynthesis C-methylase UbiE
MSDVEKDFDRLALLDEGGWTHNNHYHNFLLRNVPEVCQRALEIGCGTGAFSRRLAERVNQVTALDISSEMIRVAQSRSAQFPNLQFEIADVMSRDLPDANFDCVATIATLHHLEMREVLLKMKAALKPGGVLIILDLFEPERNLLRPEGLLDGGLNVAAMAVSGSLRLVHNGRLKPRREVRAAWEEHGKSDRYPTMNEVRALCAQVLPLAQVRKLLLWRYSVVWKKS